MPAPTTSSQYAAAQSEMIIAWWRDWVHFLEAHTTLNAIQQERMTGHATAAADAFDQDQAATSADAREREASATLDRIPAARRAVFEAELQERVAAHQAAAGAGADAPITAVTAQALGDLTDRAHGHITSGEDAGKAGVPCEGRVWFTFPPEQIHAMPPEDAWAVARPRRSALPPWRLVGATVAILAIWLGGALYYLWPQLFPPEAASAAAPPPALLVNGAPAAPWAVRAVTFGPATLPVAPLDGDAWNTTPEGMAGWRRDSAWPTALCLPATAQPLPAAITLLGAGDGLDRTFTLSADARARQPDLRLVSCARGAWLADGTLQASAPQAQRAPGAPHPIPQLGDLTLTDVRVATAAQRPTIAAGRAQVVITLAAPAGVDWPAWLPTLRLADGGAARTATVAVTDGLTTLTYDVPASALQTEDALWQITAPSDEGLGTTYRWALALTPP